MSSTSGSAKFVVQKGRVTLEGLIDRDVYYHVGQNSIFYHCSVLPTSEFKGGCYSTDSIKE